MLNCWEYMLCGNERRNCPAAAGRTFDGVHGGRNAGRACWVVLNTLCNGSIQDTLQKKYSMCGACDFYTIVKNEEGDQLIPTVFLLRMIEEQRGFNQA